LSSTRKTTQNKMICVTPPPASTQPAIARNRRSRTCLRLPTSPSFPAGC